MILDAFSCLRLHSLVVMCLEWRSWGSGIESCDRFSFLSQSVACVICLVTHPTLWLSRVWSRDSTKNHFLDSNPDPQDLHSKHITTRLWSLRQLKASKILIWIFLIWRRWSHSSIYTPRINTIFTPFPRLRVLLCGFQRSPDIVKSMISKTRWVRQEQFVFQIQKHQFKSKKSGQSCRLQY